MFTPKDFTDATVNSERDLDLDWEDLRVAVAAFSGPDFGPEYLSFAIGDTVLVSDYPGQDVDPQGWAWGTLQSSGIAGWFPPSYVKHAN